MTTKVAKKKAVSAPRFTIVRADEPSGNADMHCKKCKGYGWTDKAKKPSRCTKCGGSGTWLGGGMTDIASRNEHVSSGTITTRAGRYVGITFIHAYA